MNSDARTQTQTLTQDPPDEVEAAPPGSAGAVSSFRRLVGRAPLGRFSGFLILLAVILVFGAWVPDTFLTTVTLRNVLVSQALTAMLAVGLVIPLSAGVFDLSSAQNVGFCAVSCGVLMTTGPKLGALSAFLACIAIGAVIGVVNGVLVSGIGLDSFIATLGVSSLLTGLGAWVGDGTYYGPLPESFTRVAQGEVLGVPKLAVYLVVVAIVVWYAMEHTPVGRRVQATGANQSAARLAGLRTRQHVFVSLLVMGALAGLVGALLASNLGTVNQQLGPQYLLPAFAAVFLGATQIKPGRFNVWGTVLAVYLLGTGVQGLQLIGAKLWISDVFNGAALLVALSAALAVDRMRKRRA